MSERGIVIEISWVKAHVGLTDNELADSLAKRGLGASPVALKRQSTTDFDRLPAIGGTIVADDIRRAIARVHQIRTGGLRQLEKDIGCNNID